MTRNLEPVIKKIQSKTDLSKRIKYPTDFNKCINYYPLMRNEKACDNLPGIFWQNSEIPRTFETIKFGVHPRLLYRMRDEGRIVELSRSIFRLAEISESKKRI